MARLEPRRDAAADPTVHFLVHACKLGKVRTFESSDLYVARVVADRLRQHGWVALIFRSLPGAPGAPGGAGATETGPV